MNNLVTGKKLFKKGSTYLALRLQKCSGAFGGRKTLEPRGIPSVKGQEAMKNSTHL